MREFTGIPVSAGVAVGTAFPLTAGALKVERREIEAAEIGAEQARLDRALAVTREEFVTLRDEVSKNDASIRADILNAYLLILDDEMLSRKARELIAAERVSAEFAFKTALDGMLEVFEKMEDPYFRERAVDLGDIGNRVVLNLTGGSYRYFDGLTESAVIVAHDLPPSVTAALPRGRVAALVAEVGSRTSHTAIMAQSMEIPAVLGVPGIVGYIRGGDRVIVDGLAGRVYINPTRSIEETYGRLGREIDEEKGRRAKLAELPATTRDGYRIELSANIELVDEIEAVRRHGCDGVGLFRTEFLFLDRTDLPSEEEQYVAYRRVAAGVFPDSAIVRTIDIGGDKFLSLPEVARELNPYLGLRAIRFCLQRQDIFRTQLRAMLRASVHGKIKIMFPMISDIEELRAAQDILESVRQQLRMEGKPFDENVEVGIMVEVPSAALSADVLAQECDFFSIGTNDLIQYTLAADRGNAKIAYLYEPFHPAVLKLIRETITAAHRNGIWVGVCGEMAADPQAATLLIGFSCDELSASPVSVPVVKRAIRAIRYGDARRIAEAVVGMGAAADIRAYLAGELAALGVPAYKEQW